MNFKVVVLESDLRPEIGGDMNHERLNRLVWEWGGREKDVILDGQQPETNPIISTCLRRPSQPHENVHIGCGVYQLHY